MGEQARRTVYKADIPNIAYEYNLILKKKSNLSKSYRDHIVRRAQQLIKSGELTIEKPSDKKTEG